MLNYRFDLWRPLDLVFISPSGQLGVGDIIDEVRDGEIVGSGGI